VAKEKIRLDTLLVKRGLFASKSKAAAAVLAGKVSVASKTEPLKPGQPINEDVEITVANAKEYVSRGGIKLANAITELGVPVAGRRCLDVGASTGGFTDCLLEHGANCVTIVDVAYGELAWKLRQDDRVHLIERQNARYLKPEQLPYPPDLIVIDVSFISLTKVLPAVLSAAAEVCDCLAMVKPQFEVGADRLAKGGIVRSFEDRCDAVRKIADFSLELGYSIQGFASSGLPGPKGNKEAFIHIASAERATISDIQEKISKACE